MPVNKNEILDKLYVVAMECERRKYNGCNEMCNSCQYNLFNYVYDVREASLLKANAHVDFYNQKQLKDEIASDKFTMQCAPLVFILIIVGLISHACSGCKLYKNPSDRVTDPESAKPQILQMFMNEAENRRVESSIEQEAQYLAENPNDVKNIPRVLRLMNRVSTPDINEDGDVDCIDYSLWFRMMYGSNARLIINYNPRTNMNHMFCRVFYGDDDFMDVEPQGKPDRYSMGIIWGVKYNPMFNKDVTNQWSQVVGGMK